MKHEPRFDHSKFGWKRTNNYIHGLSDQPPSKAKPVQRQDAEGLTAQQRRRIEQIKDEKNCSIPDDTKEVWDE